MVTTRRRIVQEESLRTLNFRSRDIGGQTKITLIFLIRIHMTLFAITDKARRGILYSLAFYSC